MKQPKKITKKRIYLPKSKHKAIRAEADAAYTTVFQALNYCSNSDKAVHIRRLALEYGAKVITEVIQPMTEDDITQ